MSLASKDPVPCQVELRGAVQVPGAPLPTISCADAMAAVPRTMPPTITDPAARALNALLSLFIHFLISMNGHSYARPVQSTGDLGHFNPTKSQLSTDHDLALPLATWIEVRPRRVMLVVVVVGGEGGLVVVVVRVGGTVSWWLGEQSWSWLAEPYW